MTDQNKVEQTSMKKIINFNEICRFCLSETKSNITINEKCSSEEFKEFEADSIYNFVTKLKFIKVEDDKIFPSQVCENCFSLVKICNDFSHLCQMSDTLLRDYYEKSLKQTKNFIENDKSEIKILFETPSIQEAEADFLNCNNETFPLKKFNDISNEIQKFSKVIVNNLDKQKLYLLSGKIKEAHSKFKKEFTGLDVKNEQLTCCQCSIKFNSIQALSFHNIVTHGQKRFRNLFKFQCKSCPKSFRDQEKLKRHYKIIHKISQSEHPVKCLNSAVRTIISGVEKFFCFHCNPHKEFTSQDKLFAHLQSHKLNVSKFYSCELCSNLTFSTRADLNEHLLLVHKLNEVIKNEIIEKDLNQSNVLICLKPVENFQNVENLSKMQQSKSLTDLSAFINILDSVVESLTAAEQEKESGFKVICKNCSPPLEFISTGDFINHINTNHHGLKLLKNWIIESKPEKDNSWICTECPASYSRKQSLYCHIREKHKHTIFDGMKCPEPGCSESFNTNRQLIQHGIAVHHKYFAYFHKVFKKVLQSTDVKEDNRVKNFECDICQKKYIYKTSLKKHIFGSHLEKSVKNSVACPYCGKTISNKLNLKSHIEFVHEALFVSCPICKKKINFRTIGKHYKTHKTNSDILYSKNSFLCNLCGKILKSKRSFEDHQKLHKNIRDELCDICGSGFTTKKFLRLHKKTHEGVQRKIFGCDQCDKVFSGRQTLNRHLLTHSGKKNFICEICSKCFYTLQELNRHVRYHKKEYRFDCQLCDMRFLDKSRFRHHMMRHRNIRPHKCQFCEKMFIVRGKMNLHMAAKHNVEVESRKGVWKDPKTYVPLDDLL